jgi:hypothetical protein
VVTDERKTVSYSGYILNEDSQLQWLQMKGRRSVTVVTNPNCVNKIKNDTTDGLVACMRGAKMYTRVLWRKLWERKEPRGRPRCRWEVTNNMEGMDWVYPFENRNESFAVVKAVMNGVSLLGCDAASLGIW